MNHPLFQTPDDERSDDNPRGCVIFRIHGFHVYAADGMCRDCGKPNPRPASDGRD